MIFCLKTCQCFCGESKYSIFTHYNSQKVPIFFFRQVYSVFVRFYEGIFEAGEDRAPPLQGKGVCKYFVKSLRHKSGLQTSPTAE